MKKKGILHPSNCLTSWSILFITYVSSISGSGDQGLNYTRTFSADMSAFSYEKPGSTVRKVGFSEGKSTCCASTLQRQKAKNLKQIFPEKEYRGLSPNFHIHVSVSELYFPTVCLPFLLEEICGPILGIYKSLNDT